MSVDYAWPFLKRPKLYSVESPAVPEVIRSNTILFALEVKLSVQ